MKKKSLIIILMAIILILIIPLSLAISKDRISFFPKEVSKEYTTPQQLFYGFLGQFGQTLASYLWIKADFYHHEYPGYWTTNKEYMPLIKFITLLDPHFRQAYSFGGYHLAINLDKANEGVNFLKEGLKYNPDDYDLNYSLAYVYWKKLGNYYGSLKYADKAIRLAEDEAKDKKDDLNLINALRLKVASQESLKDYSGAIQTLKTMLRLHPKDKTSKGRLEHFKKLLKSPPSR